jgi:hypothetical protein
MADTRGNFKLNFELCYLNNAAILQYGDFCGNFKLMLNNLNIYYSNKAAIFKYGG